MYELTLEHGILAGYEVRTAQPPYFPPVIFRRIHLGLDEPGAFPNALILHLAKEKLMICFCVHSSLMET